MRAITEAEKIVLRGLAREVGPVATLYALAAAYQDVAAEAIVPGADGEQLERWALRVRELVRLAIERPA